MPFHNFVGGIRAGEYGQGTMSLYGDNCVQVRRMEQRGSPLSLPQGLSDLAASS